MNVDYYVSGAIRTQPWDLFEERIRSGQVLPETPVRCLPLTGDRFLPVGELLLYQEICTSDAVRLSRWLARRGVPLLTSAIAGLCITIFFWGLPRSRGDLAALDLSAWGQPILEQGEIWRLLTGAFVHGSASHLAVNLVFLFFAGWSVERALGRVNLLCLSLCAVLWSSAFAVLLSPDQPILGSSGLAFAFISTTIVFGWRNRANLPREAQRFYGNAMVPWLAPPLLLGFSQGQVHTWGHIAGIVSGLLMGSLLESHALPRHAPRNRRMRRYLLLSCLLLLAGFSAWAWGSRALA